MPRFVRILGFTKWEVNSELIVNYRIYILFSKHKQYLWKWTKMKIWVSTKSYTKGVERQWIAIRNFLVVQPSWLSPFLENSLRVTLNRSCFGPRPCRYTLDKPCQAPQKTRFLFSRPEKNLHNKLKITTLLTLFYISQITFGKVEMMLSGLENISQRMWVEFLGKWWHCSSTICVFDVQ